MSDLSGLLHGELEAVEARCAACARSPGPAADAFIDLFTRSATRALRPALLLVASRMCGYRGDQAVQYATALELIHYATLLHTNVRANEAGAQGRLTQQRNDALLLGDYLYVSAMRLALAPGRLDIVELICGATSRTFEGEIYQLSAASAPRDSGWLEMTAYRTAPLFATAADIGARLGRADAASRMALTRYGFGFGLAFQLFDEDATVNTLALQHAHRARVALGALTKSAERDVLIALIDAVVPPVHAEHAPQPTASPVE